MTKEDIIRMAREARLDVYGIGSNHDTFMLILENFANLVARQERKRIAQKIEQLPFGDTAASFSVYVREA